MRRGRHSTGWTRRGLLGATAAAGALGLAPRRARASVSGADRKFIFIFNQGGWDPTRALADGLDNRAVDVEPGADRGRQGDLTWVEHADRPSVSTFFEQHADRCVIVNGMLVRSIAHEICTLIAMTGTTSGLTPDWPAILAAAGAGGLVLPHLVLGGPSFPGDLGEAVVRSGASGQLDALLNGSIQDWNDSPVTSLGAPGQGIVDAYVRRRAAARAAAARGGVDQALTGAFASAVERSVDLKDLRYVVDFSAGSDLAGAGAVATEALSQGLCRCVSIGFPAAAGEWDTHTQNDQLQSPLWDDLFEGLLAIQDQLDRADGTAGGSLADETVLVVLSEMGRTPALNALQGKDHWPYTSALLVGSGLDGGRVIGGFDERWYGLPVDPSSGEASDQGQILSAESLGATLLALGDVDPGPYTQGVQPITGILA